MLLFEIFIFMATALYILDWDINDNTLHSCLIVKFYFILDWINASLIAAVCKFLFRDTRASVLEQSLRKLGVEKLSKEDVQKMQWEVLEAKIGNWIHFMRIAVRIYFSNLCLIV